MKLDAQVEGNYRYTLDRIWREDLPRVLWVMLNPSTADALKDDPTIRRCIGFSMRWGYGGLRVVNLFAFRSTSPKVMFSKWTKEFDIIGEKNWEVLVDSVDTHKLVIAAWGNDGAKFPKQSLSVIFDGVTPKCLGKSGAGQPYHPLYQPYDRKLLDFEIAGQ